MSRRSRSTSAFATLDRSNHLLRRGMTPAHDGHATAESTGLTRRQALKVGAATFVGYAVGVDKALAQAIKTDTDGLVAGDQTVAIGSYNMPVYEARPPPARAIRSSSCSPRSGASTSGSRTSRAGSPRRAITVSPPSCSSARAGSATSPTSRTS